MRTRLSICARKVRFSSGPDAYRAAAAATIVLRPYRCDRCRQFHLTSRTKGKRVPRPGKADLTRVTPHPLSTRPHKSRAARIAPRRRPHARERGA